MTKITALVADDEPLARERLVRLLKPFANIDLKAVCENGEQALKSINELQPQLVFLDIQMPGLSGFDVLTHITCETKPWIIFVTAYDDYAIQAFEFHALDYLLKPFKDSRFEEAVTRATEQINLQQQGRFQQSLNDMIESQKDAKNVEQFDLVFIEVKVQGREKKVPSAIILWIESEGNYVTLHTTDGDYLYRSTISALEYDLCDAGFHRIHRSILFNVSALAQVRYLHSNNQYKFVLKNGEELISARSYKDRVIQFLDSHPQFAQ